MVSEYLEPEVSVIIVNWNTRDLLSDCIQSIYRETSISHEVIVIDNFSSDGSVEMLRDKFSDIRIIENNENRGFARANNQGIEIARGKHILLLNPDTIILENAIDRMVLWLSDKPDVGCVGCQVWETDRDIQRTCFADPGPINLAIVTFGLMRLADRFPVLGRPWYLEWDRCSERDVDVVSGMFMLVSRLVIERVGLLDEKFFVYAEEADWCRRIRKAGWRCVFAPEARILHLDGGSKSTAQIKPRMHVQMQKSHLIYVRKHYGWTGYLLVKTFLIVSATLRLGVFGPLQLIRPDETTWARVRLSRATLRYLLMGREPTP